MRNKYMSKFFLRTSIFLVSLILFIFDRKILKSIINLNIGPLKLYHIIWLLLILEMLAVCIPRFNNKVTYGKLFLKHFNQTDDSSKDALSEAITDSNKKAMVTMLSWIAINIPIAALFYAGVFSEASIHMIVVFYYFSDQFCINVWCPFRSWTMRTRCCTTCRIYNWGHFMMFLPYAVLPGFLTWSLLILALFILIQWEYIHNNHPERFYEITNKNLLCTNCKLPECHYKNASKNRDSSTYL